MATLNLYVRDWTTVPFLNKNFQLKFLSFEELQQRMAKLDLDMEREIDELRRRYQIKRQPILDAMDTKRKRQQNFWEQSGYCCNEEMVLKKFIFYYILAI